MSTTTITIPIEGRAAENLIHPLTLRCIGARDAMVDGAGVFSFLYGHGRTVRRAEVRQTAPDVYSIDFEHIDPQTHVLVVDRTVQDVQAADLRATIRELV